MPPTAPVYPVQSTIFPQPTVPEVVRNIKPFLHFYIHYTYLQTVDIGSIVSQRLAAMRKLRENPNDVFAQNEMYRAQNEV